MKLFYTDKKHTKTLQICC